MCYSGDGDRIIAQGPLRASSGIRADVSAGNSAATRTAARIQSETLGRTADHPGNAPGSQFLGAGCTTPTVSRRRAQLTQAAPPNGGAASDPFVICVGDI